MNKQPEKTAQTRKNIVDAFWRLAAKEGVFGVTACAIAKEAGINRGTFYVYFKDTRDLLEQEERLIGEGFRDIVARPTLESIFRDFPHVSEKAVKFIKEYDDKLYLLLGQRGDANFMRIVSTEASRMLREMLGPVGDHEMIDYIIAYYCAALVGMLTLWYDSGRRADINEIAELSHVLSKNGFCGLLALIPRGLINLDNKGSKK